MATVNVSYDERPEGVVATITLDRSDKANALSNAMAKQLKESAVTLRTMENLRCVIITGVNDRMFCAGSDLKELSELTSGSAGGFLRATHAALKAVREIPVPVIARIQGPCMGTGMELAAVCDFRLAAANGLFAMPMVKIGLPSVIEAALIARIIGSGRASWMMMTGDNVGAQKACEWGFLEDVAEDTAALDAAVQSAVKGILESGRQAIFAQKRLIRSWEEQSLAQSVEESIRPFASAHATNEPGQLSAKVLGRLSKSG